MDTRNFLSMSFCRLMLVISLIRALLHRLNVLALRGSSYKHEGHHVLRLVESFGLLLRVRCSSRIRTHALVGEERWPKIPEIRTSPNPSWLARVVKACGAAPKPETPASQSPPPPTTAPSTTGVWRADFGCGVADFVLPWPRRRFANAVMP